MGIWESIAFLLLCVAFIALLIFAPLLVEKGIKRSLPFRAEEVGDIVYQGKILTFTTKRRDKVCHWRFKGDCTVWYWASTGNRCSTSIEYELCLIWEIAKTK